MAILLYKKYPTILKEWDEVKNIGVNPKDISIGVKTKYWWKCPKGPDHEWKASPNHRTSGVKLRGCPFCAGKRISVTNSLEKNYLEIAKEWHPTKNGKLSAHEVTSGSSKRVWWKCIKGSDHEWESTIKRRISEKSGCPCCSGCMLSKNNNLKYLNPNLAKEWHPTKNGKLKPNHVLAGTKKKYWWKCKKGTDHEWQASCDTRHNNNRGCPFCAGKSVSVTNSLKSLFPENAKEWHPTKNGKLKPEHIVARSDKKVWWICNKGPDHEWQAKCHKRTTSGRGCPFCAGRSLSVTNSLEALYPELSKQWFATRNNNITPDQILAGTHGKYWWKCNNGDEHIWEASINNRTKNNSGCPFCFLKPRSRQEIYLAYELNYFIDFDVDAHKLILDKKLYDLDIILENEKIIVEYDGYYWHKEKFNADSNKNKKLTKNGWTVIRVREKPLKKTSNIDILIEQGDVKTASNLILNKIQTLDKKLIKRLKQYQKNNELINKNNAEKEIKKILSKKKV